MNLVQTPTRAVITLASAAFLLTACGPAAGSSPTPKTAATAAVDNGTGGADPAGGGGEAAGVRFVSTQFHYRVDAPGPMTEAADGTASAARGVERLSVKVVTGGAVADLKSHATSDLQAVKTASPGFRQLGGITTLTIGGHVAYKAVYQWTDGSNPVTGKPLDLVSVRYYIPRDSNTAAVLTYSITTSQYDPHGADDVASTFAWQ